ncbi:MAG: TlyA family RNA methyltransferase [Actinomycetes bacterium]
MARRRLDAELVRRHLSRSREAARLLIAAGHVQVGGFVITKAASMVSDADSIVVAAELEPQYASRGAHKLLGALDAFVDVEVSELSCLDAGASTGGFTDVLLARGAATVLAVDVGYGQLVSRLANDERVLVFDRLNARHLQLTDLPHRADLTVADLSFISLRLVLPALARVTASDGQMLVMVKPQFEVGKDRLGRGGVVRDPQLRSQVVESVAHSAYAEGWGTAGVVASPLPGPQGNVEYFLWLRRDAGPAQLSVINQAVKAGPI